MNENVPGEQNYALLTDAVASLPAGVLILDTETNILRYINSAACKILNVNEADIIGQPVPDYIGSCLDREISDCEITITGPDGAEITILRHSHFMEHGKRTYRVESITDITMLKQLERETKEEMERALKKSEEYAKKADQANRSKGSFLANMSHEIRTPLNGVLGFLSLLGGTKLSNEQSEYLQSAENSAKILLALISDILDFSKIEAGKLDLEQIPFNLVDTIEDTAAIFAPKSVEKKNDICVCIHPGVPVMCKGDPNRFRQILMNLCSNAVKFTKGGRIEVHAFLEKQDRKKITVRIEVSDTGVGLSPVKLKKIFEPFSQASPSVAREFGGSGLGLAISKQLVKMLNGKIWAESTEGEGSKFSFTIQLGRAAGQPGPGNEQTLRGRKLLYLISSGAFPPSGYRYCEEWGMEVFREESADIKAFDAVCVDYGIGETPDFGMLRQLRDNCRDEVPLICFRYLHEAAGKRSLEEELGITALAKPVRKFQLLRALTGTGEESSGTSGAAEDSGEAGDVRSGINGRERVHILIAEDNKINQKLTARILEKAGYSYDVAADGNEALRQYRENNYQLILMDCLMPGMDGYVATLKIRQIEKREGLSRIPIVALTANALKGERQKVLSAGMDDYLSKPVDPKTMIDCIEKWLQKESSR